jgi:hypothetical protein
LRINSHLSLIAPVALMSVTDDTDWEAEWIDLGGEG